MRISVAWHGLLYREGNRKYNGRMKTFRRNEQGAVSGSMIAIVGLIVLVLGAGSFGIWAYMQYDDASANLKGKVDLAVAEAKKEQADEDEQKFAEREKEPNRLFVGPDDYGRLTFNYPKTWSVFEAKDTAKGGTYEAYLNPIVVPPVTTIQQFALRVTIEEKDYDQVVDTYERLVKKGELRSSATSSNGHSGTRFDGNFNKNIRGSAVLYKIRDKTVTIRTDANTFKPDFEKIIKTIDFNN